MRRVIITILLGITLYASPLAVWGKGLPEIPLTSEWKQQIRELSPTQPQATPKAPRKVMIFSLATGFKHWCIPHTEAVLKILGETSGAYSAENRMDIDAFLPENLKNFDAVILNNTCPDRKDRNVFNDVLIHQIDKYGEQYKHLSLSQREELAETLFRSLMDYVSAGGGLVLMHGAITSFNYSDEFSRMVGGSFDYHPPQQKITLELVDPQHPLLAPFQGQDFIDFDEAYLMKGAYDQMNFRPLLELKTDLLRRHKRLAEIQSKPRYMAWIKSHQKGRVFYCGPSHNAQSFKRPELLTFMLNGIQYALGDLECDDQPLPQ